MTDSSVQTGQCGSQKSAPDGTGLSEFWHVLRSLQVCYGKPQFDQADLNR
ncbi:MAG: hypothetical protein AAGD09_11755 [Cyanobacteria bacterium P01_F01_bin.56]